MQIIIRNSFLDEKIILLTEDNFNLIVMESNEMWLVLFVDATNSGESFKSEWAQANKELSGKVNLGIANSKDLAIKCGVKSFPTIMYFTKGHKSDSNGNGNYEGDITANGIVTWALKIYNGKTIGKYRYLHFGLLVNVF